MLLAEAVLSVLAIGVNFYAVKGARRLGLALSVWTTVSLSTQAAEAIRLFEWMPAAAWLRALGFLWALLAVPGCVLARLWTRSSSEPDPGRRQLLRAGAAVAAAPLAATAFAIHKATRDAEIREVELAVPDLPPDLQGLRIVQLSDIHLGSFFTPSQLRRVVDQANGLRADVAVVTGDLISSFGDPLEEAIAELARLRTAAGTFGCLGNHEIVAECEALATRLAARRGIRMLRSQSTSLRFGKSNVNVAGIDYQRKGSPYLATAAGLLQPGELNLLLSHNPDVFPMAVRQNWNLVLSGHTHGGQITLEYLDTRLNPARFYTPYTYGRYTAGAASLFVTSGLGTVGVPARLGTSPELVSIRLTSRGIAQRTPRPDPALPQRG
jgi:predicted MPP superfamily phosphohydrolase